MAKLLMLKGLPASGKSTYARELVAKGWKRVNKDDLRAMIDSSKFSRTNEKEVIEVERRLAEHYILNGFNVVVDDTNFAYENEWKLFAGLLKAEFEVKFFDTPFMECIERDSKRGEKSVGQKVITRMYEQHLRPKKPPYDRELDSAFIFDIDGTLAKMNGRSPYDYSKVLGDLPNTDIVVLFKTLRQSGLGDKLIVMSGREGTVQCQEDTVAWLDRNDIVPDALLMRNAGDTRKDSIVKEELYREHILGRYNILGVFDDRNQVVDMWRSLGLTCLQVDYGNF